MPEEKEIILDDRIQKVGVVAKEAFIELKKLQKGDKLIVKSGEDFIDSHIGGLLPGDCILLAGSPSSGKSESLYRMIDKMMDININPAAKEFVSLEFSFEMRMLNKLLRSGNRLLSKKKSEILFTLFDEEEAKKMKEYYDNLNDDRRFVVQAPVTPEDFYKMTRDFCILNSSKQCIILSVDHILLYIGTDKQLVLEKVSEYLNLLKLEFSNVYFAVLSQLNRSALSVLKDKSNDMIPNNGHIYGSSFMEQFASYIIIITNPYKQAITSYLKFGKDRYEYLSEFFCDEDKNGKISFETAGNLFYFVTKARETDNSSKNLFIRKMDLSEEELKRMKKDVEDNKNEISTKTISLPVFENFNSTAPLPTVKPFDAFGQSFEKDKEPF